MIKVLISRNYSFPDFKRQTPGGTGIWNDVEFTEDPNEEVDFIVVLNQPATDIFTKAFQGGRWLFLQEPPYTRNDYFKYHFRFADKVISGFSDKIANNEHAQAGLPWHIGRSYDELMELKLDSVKKIDRVSWITSNNNMFPGHQPRLNFINFLNKSEFDYDLYGRGFQPIEDKFDGIAPYKYSIAVENYSAPDYWTEKVIDCMLSWTIPFYFGCENMERYFPTGSFISIDIHQPEKALRIIKDAIADNHWEKNLEALAEARQLILNEYQLFPMLEKRIHDFNNVYPNAKKKKYFIPKSGLTKVEIFKKQIRSVRIP